MCTLQENDYRRNQRRVAVARYLGELYNYSLIDSTVIFDTLYLFLTFGHERGKADPEKGSPIDAPDDFFRIRLVGPRPRLFLSFCLSPCPDRAERRPGCTDLHPPGHLRQLLQQGQGQGAARRLPHPPPGL